MGCSKKHAQNESGCIRIWNFETFAIIAFDTVAFFVSGVAVDVMDEVMQVKLCKL